MNHPGSFTRRAVMAGLGATAAMPAWAQTVPSDPDVVIVGAGTAGLSAARTLIGEGASVAIVEAADRIGGRAWTDSATFGVPFDHGCSWVMGPADLPLVAMARDWGFTLLDHDNAGESLYVGDRRATGQEVGKYDSAWTSVGAALDSAGAKGLDVAASTVIPGDLEYSGVAQTWMGPMDWAVDFEDLSTMDNWMYGDVGSNYMIKEGFGTLIEMLGAGLPVQLGTPATAIDWSGSGVAVETPSGVIRSKACIVTVSTGVLQAGTIGFAPALPVWKQEAIDRVPMGLLVKVALEFDGERFGLGANNWLTYWVDNAMPAEACYYLTFPFDFDLMIGFIGGRFGWDLSAEGPDAVVDFALGELVETLGSRARDHFVRGRATRWADNPWTLGAYAAATPGHYGARGELARPVADRIFFAGEAVAMPWVQLCGGAYLSGEAVAREVASAIA